MHGGLICLAFCLSVVWTGPKITENNSYLGKYYRWEAETLPLYRELLGALWKNTNYTLKEFLPVNMGFFVKILATAVLLVAKNGTKLYHNIEDYY